MQKLSLLSILLVSLTNLTGCTVLKKVKGPAQEKVHHTGETRSGDLAMTVDKELLELAKSVEGSLHTLASAQKAESQPILNTAPLMTPEGGMGGTADMDWTGPIGPLIEKIAKMSDYRVKVLGTEPGIPIIVTINVKHGIIAEILQNASLQAGKRAEILVFPENRVIEVRYLS
jgi:defect-in-organelle-trafficking protein DotD